MVWANGFSLSLASCCGVGPPVSCAPALAAPTEPVTIPSSARRRASLLLVKMRLKPSSAQSASLPDIRVPLPHRRLDALHRCPPITPSAASTRRPFWWQATPAWRSLGTRQSSCSRTNSFRRVGPSRRRKLEGRVGFAHRAGGGRRPDRRRLGAGTIGRRRDAQPRRRSASPGRAGRGRHRRPTASPPKAPPSPPASSPHAPAEAGNKICCEQPREACGRAVCASQHRQSSCQG